MSAEYLLKMELLRQNREELTARRQAIERRMALREATAAEHSAVALQHYRQRWKSVRAAAVAARTRNDEFLRDVRETQRRVTETHVRSRQRLWPADNQLAVERERFFRKVEELYPAWQEKSQAMRLQQLRELEEQKRVIEKRRFLARKTFETEQTLDGLIRQTSHEVELAKNLEKNEAYEREVLRHQNALQAKQLDQTIRDHAVGARMFVKQQADEHEKHLENAAEGHRDVLFEAFSPRGVVKAMREAKDVVAFVQTSSISRMHPPQPKQHIIIPSNHQHDECDIPTTSTSHLSDGPTENKPAAKSMNSSTQQEHVAASSMFGDERALQAPAGRDHAHHLEAYHYSPKAHSGTKHERVVPDNSGFESTGQTTMPVQPSTGSFQSASMAVHCLERVDTMGNSAFESMGLPSVHHGEGVGILEQSLNIEDYGSTSVHSVEGVHATDPSPKSQVKGQSPTFESITIGSERIDHYYGLPPNGVPMPSNYHASSESNEGFSRAHVHENSLTPFPESKEYQVSEITHPGVNVTDTIAHARGTSDDEKQHNESRSTEISSMHTVGVSMHEYGPLRAETFQTGHSAVTMDVCSPRSPSLDESQQLPVYSRDQAAIALPCPPPQFIEVLQETTINDIGDVPSSPTHHGPGVTMTSEAPADLSLNITNSVDSNRSSAIEFSIGKLIDTPRPIDTESNEQSKSLMSDSGPSTYAVNEVEPQVKYGSENRVSKIPSDGADQAPKRTHPQSLALSSMESISEFGSPNVASFASSIPVAPSDEGSPPARRADNEHSPERDIGDCQPTAFSPPMSPVEPDANVADDPSPAFTLSIPERLKALSTLVQRVEEAAAEGEKLNCAVDSGSTRATKQELLRMATGGRKAQVNCFGIDVCFEVVVELAQAMGPVLFPTKVFEGILNEQKMKKVHQYAKEKELDVWKTLSSHIKQLDTLKVMPVNTIVDIFLDAFLQHDSTNQRSQRKLREFLLSICGATDTSPKKTPSQMEKINAVFPASTDASRPTIQSGKVESRHMPVPSLLQTALLQPSSPPKSKSYGLASQKKTSSTDDLLKSMASSPSRLSQRLMRGGKMGDYSEFEEEDEVNLENLLGSKSITKVDASKGDPSVAMSRSASSISRHGTGSGSSSRLATTREDREDFDVDF